MLNELRVPLMSPTALATLMFRAFVLGMSMLKAPLRKVLMPYAQDADVDHAFYTACVAHAVQAAQGSAA